MYSHMHAGVYHTPVTADNYGSEQTTVQTFLSTLEQLSELEKSRDELLCRLKQLQREIDEKEQELLSIPVPKEGAMSC